MPVTASRRAFPAFIGVLKRLYKDSWEFKRVLKRPYKDTWEFAKKVFSMGVKMGVWHWFNSKTLNPKPLNSLTRV